MSSKTRAPEKGAQEGAAVAIASKSAELAAETLGLVGGIAAAMKDPKIATAVAATARAERAIAELGSSQEHRLPRDGSRDLVFRGWKLGAGAVVGGKFDREIEGGSYERVTEVTLYLTEGRNYVIHETRVRNWGDQRNDDVTVISGEGDPRVQTVVDGGTMRPESEIPAEDRLLRKLGSMGPATRDAWNEACKRYAPLRVLETERID